MSNNDDNTNFGLSRRKMLGGLGVIGVASAGAGLGTTAYFSDQVEFEDNELRAGTLALNVTQTIHTLDQDGIGPDEETYFNGNDGPVEVDAPIVITDAKPGDSYEFCWEVYLEGNPGYAMVKVDDVSDLTGADVGTVFADDLYDVHDDDDMVTLGEAATATATLTLCDEPEEGEATATGDEVPIFPPEGEDVDDSLGALLNVLAGGLPVPSGFLEEDDPEPELVDDPASDSEVDPEVDPEEDPAPEPEFCHDIECPVKLCVTIDIDTDVGNELQGAESGFNLHVYAEQCRHNDVDTFMGENGENGYINGGV